MNTFSKVAGFKINIQKSVAFQYTNSEQTEKEFRETISFTVASKKYLQINILLFFNRCRICNEGLSLIPDIDSL
jgi:hypothetical protein